MNKQISILLLVLISGTLFAQQAYQWRGANRDGIYNEKGLLKE